MHEPSTSHSLIKEQFEKLDKNDSGFVDYSGISIFSLEFTTSMLSKNLLESK